MIDIHIVMRDGRPMGGWAGKRTASDMARLGPGMTVETVAVPDVLFAVTEGSARRASRRTLYEDDFALITNALKNGDVPKRVAEIIEEVT